MQIIGNGDDIFSAYDEEMKHPEMYTILYIIYYMHYTHYIHIKEDMATC